MPSRKLIALCFVLVGCASQPYQGQTTFEVEMGYTDTYSSTTGELTRTTCLANDAHILVKLSPAQLDEIGRTATDSGFFSLPSSLPLAAGDDDRIMVTSPCADYALDIYHSGQHHRVTGLATPYMVEFIRHKCGRFTRLSLALSPLPFQSFRSPRAATIDP
jgi:hypothetical protein